MHSCAGRLLIGDCRERLRDLPDASIDAVVTDPPYELGFMGKAWDAAGVAYDVGLWAEVLRVLKPGGHLLAFGGTRTYHRMACAIEDAGFEIRDSIHWLYGSGFPKSLDVSKAIDKAAGAVREVLTTVARTGSEGGGKTVHQEGGDKIGVSHITAPATDAARQWSGWGTALKPAHEPIVVARKPLVGTVAGNVLAHGTGALNIDGCRVGSEGGTRGSNYAKTGLLGIGGKADIVPLNAGRWPANLAIDDVIAGRHPEWAHYFYTAKPSRRERNADDTVENRHPTVKPLALMRWLVRLVTPPGGIVLDPFLGSGTTAVAAILEGFDWRGCEMTAEFLPIIEGRVGGIEGTTRARSAVVSAMQEPLQLQLI